LATLIGELAEKIGIPAGSLGERDAALDHGVLVPLYFLHSVKDRNIVETSRIIRIGLSGLSLADHYRFGMTIQAAIGKLSRKTVLIASGDMSHKLKADGPYGFAKEGPEHDAYVQTCVADADFRRLLAVDPILCEQAAECGLRSLVILAGALDGLQVKSRLLSYEGPFGVGYLTAAFFGEREAPSLLPVILADRKTRLEKMRDTKDVFVRLARENIEHFVKTGEVIPLPADLPIELLNERSGVFVSVKKDGVLRGCIGTISPAQENIALEIIENSVSSVSRDSRFPPVTVSELESLTYSVDVLSPSEPIDSPDELDVVKYGVIVSCGRRRGLLLPNLDGVDTVEEQISIALQKGGIRPGEPYKLERFEVVRHK
jgi:AmmeMemoRadiSam system protein A